MKTLPKILLAVAAFSLAYPASVQAVPTTYQYTGNPFQFATAPYTTSDFVTAMVTLASPLPPNFANFVTPTAFTLSDGVQTITLQTALGFDFVFITDATGAITFWSIEVLRLTPMGGLASITTFRMSEGAPPAADIGISGGGDAINNDTPGTWARVSGVPDTGSTLLMMMLTLMAFGLVARRFQRAAGWPRH
jgi:hypothetical protein